jgi:Gpi18-like mannosyltransferase
MTYRVETGPKKRISLHIRGKKFRQEEVQGDMGIHFKLAHKKRWLLVFSLLIAALGIRASLFFFTTGDTQCWVIPWYDHIAKYGYTSLGGNFPNCKGFNETSGNYPPPYYYILYIATLFDSFVPKLYLIKIISVLFDFVAAFFVYLFAKRSEWSHPYAWLWFFVPLFAPTVIANGSLWGQCDIIPFSLLIGAVYFSVVSKPFWAVVFFLPCTPRLCCNDGTGCNPRSASHGTYDNLLETSSFL